MGDENYSSWRSVRNTSYWEIPRMGKEDILYSYLITGASIYGMDWKFASVVYNKRMFKDLNEDFFHISPHAEAYEGSKALCLFTWLKYNPEQRCYASVKLSEAMEKGKSYCISFRLTSGRNYVTHWASNGLGLYFSNERLTQPEKLTRINAKPQIEFNEIFSDTNWIEVAFKFVADSNYSFFHLGNFRETKDISLKEIQGNPKYSVSSPCGFTGAYYFIDDVRIEPFLPEKHQKKVMNFRQYSGSLSPRSEVISAEGDTLVLDKQHSISIHEKKITLTVEDYLEEDGDTISVYHNGKLVLEKYMLTKKPKKITLEMPDSLKSNLIVMKAHNLGKIPPNTSLMKIYEGKQVHIIKISSTLEHSGTVELIRTE
jgi:hypothetical protein